MKTAVIIIAAAAAWLLLAATVCKILSLNDRENRKD